MPATLETTLETTLERPTTSTTERAAIPAIGFCREKQRLVNAFLSAVREMNVIEAQQVQAVIDGDRDFSRFDVLLHFALEKKNMAKYMWIAHVENHGCAEE